MRICSFTLVRLTHAHPPRMPLHTWSFIIMLDRSVFTVHIIMSMQMTFIVEPDSTLITFLVCPEIIIGSYLFNCRDFYVLISNSAPDSWPVRSNYSFLSPASPFEFVLILVWVSASGLTLAFRIPRSLGAYLVHLRSLWVPCIMPSRWQDSAESPAFWEWLCIFELVVSCLQLGWLSGVTERAT